MLTVVIPDESEARVLTAFGHGASADDHTWVPATPEEFDVKIKAFINQRVFDHESLIAELERVRPPDAL